MCAEFDSQENHGQFGVTPRLAEAPSQEPRPIRVLFLSQQRLVRECLQKAIAEFPEVSFLPPVATTIQAIELLRASWIDVVLVDLNPSMFGLRVAKELQDGCPDCRIVILSSHPDEITAIQLRLAGVRAFITKDIGIADLISALREAASNQVEKGVGSGAFQSGRLFPNAAERGLTNREAQVLEMVARGFANKQVAAELGISIKTVEKHRKSVMEKLHASEAAGMIWSAFCMGVARPNHGESIH